MTHYTSFAGHCLIEVALINIWCKALDNTSVYFSLGIYIMPLQYHISSKILELLAAPPPFNIDVIAHVLPLALELPHVFAF